MWRIDSDFVHSLLSRATYVFTPMLRAPDFCFIACQRTYSHPPHTHVLFTFFSAATCGAGATSAASAATGTALEVVSTLSAVHQLHFFSCTSSHACSSCDLSGENSACTRSEICFIGSSAAGGGTPTTCLLVRPGCLRISCCAKS